MRLKKTVILTLTVAVILGCKDERKFPKVRKLTELKRTDFLPTLEHKISPDRNSIYCVTFLYAWDEVRQAIKTPLQIDKSLHDLNLIHQSKHYSGALRPDEYVSSGVVNDQSIETRAEFKKSLPFQLELTDFGKELTFNGVMVPSFGVKGYDHEKSKIIRIVYYKNDDSFIIKLLPKNNDHEIYLIKTPTIFKSMSEMVSEIEAKSKVGQIENQQEEMGWRYHLTDDDEVVIPKFEFNLETDCKLPLKLGHSKVSFSVYKQK